MNFENSANFFGFREFELQKWTVLKIHSEVERDDF